MIYHVCDRMTERVWKIAYAQQCLGKDVTIIYRTDCHPDLLTTMVRVSRWLDPCQIAGKLDSVPDDSRIWVHASINSTFLFDLFGQSPRLRLLRQGFHALYFDVHDWTDAAAKAICKASPDRVFTPSKGMADHVRKVWFGRVDCLYSMVPHDYHTYADRQIDAVSLVAGAEIDGVVWRDYRQVAKWLNPRLFLFPCFVDQPKIAAYYNVMQRLPYSVLLPTLAKFQQSWCGAANDQHRIDDCVTNKFWNALAVRSKPIVWRSAEMEQICGQYGVGALWHECHPISVACKTGFLNMAKWREKFAMETQIELLT
jgi:hypothetical protein